MGTKFVGSCMKEEYMEVPPGFESLFPVTPMKAEHYKVDHSSSVAAVESHKVALKDESRTTKSLRHCRGVQYYQFDDWSGDEYEYNQVLPKWHPEEARRPDLEDAPVFYPTEEEFEDTLKYISCIRAKAQAYGICRIVPPPSWKPPCPLREKNVWECSKFATRAQRIDKLQNRCSIKKMRKAYYSKKRKRRRCMKNESDSQTSNDEDDVSGEDDTECFGFEPGPNFTLDSFQKYADHFMMQYFNKQRHTLGVASSHEVPERWQPSLEEIEGEYWRMVEKPSKEVEVLYGADVETSVFGSGFPKTAQQVTSASDTKYITSGWNLNNFPRLPGSVLSYESDDISGVLVPWLYIGMCFSTFCWHVEDHYLYSLSYMHWGAPKLWYGVPGSEAVKLEAAMRKHLPDLFEEQPDLLHKLVTQLSPSILKSEGVPVYRCVQNRGEFVMTFPRAYHAGLNCGFNCAEAVNIAPVDWLLHGQKAIELYRQQCRKTSISHDKLLLGAAREAVRAQWDSYFLKKTTFDNTRWKDFCGVSGLLSKALKTRVEMERANRELLCKSSQALKMESSFDANNERECCVCYFDLHFSAVGCHHCSPGKYACLNHAKQLCSCSWGAKFYLFRYAINELNILVEALEGKMSSLYRWVRLDLGLSLTSCVSKDDTPALGIRAKSCTSQGFPKKETNTLPVAAALKEQKRHVDGSIHKTENVPPLNALVGLSSWKLETDARSFPFPGRQDVIDLSHDEEDEKGASIKQSGNSQTHICSEGNASSIFIKVEGCGEGERDHKAISVESSCFKVHEDGVPEQKSQQVDEVKLCYEDDESEEMDAGSRSTQSSQALSRSQFGPWNISNQHIHQVNLNVEPLNFGSLHAGKLWSDSQAIYPNGFRSRVRYINVLDPTNMCYYISQIVDIERDGPLFMVCVEHCPSEVFVHTSAARCWDMVRERVNLEIAKQHKLGKVNLPPLQPPGSVNGIKMFGFSTPEIVQTIQAMDQQHICSEYWRSRPPVRICWENASYTKLKSEKSN